MGLGCLGAPEWFRLLATLLGHIMVAGSPRFFGTITFRRKVPLSFQFAKWRPQNPPFARIASSGMYV